jgi:NAD(P)-dependent dehydrogenase (short-subunit alcohol dehydrogenase family)
VSRDHLSGDVFGLHPAAPPRGALRDDEQVRAHIGASTAMGRVGEPDEIAGVIAALLGPGAGWVTGQRIEASGGMLL